MLPFQSQAAQWAKVASQEPRWNMLHGISLTGTWILPADLLKSKHIKARPTRHNRARSSKAILRSVRRRLVGHMAGLQGL